MAKTPEDLERTATHAPTELTEKQRVQALVICIVTAFLTLLDVSIVTVALPSMEHHLHLSSADVTWAVAGYTLTFGLMLVPAGRLGDEFGRRRIFLIGMVLFIVTGVLCGAAPDATWLDASRLARGASAGLIAPRSSDCCTRCTRPANGAGPSATTARR
jgi:MFS family permease